MGGLFGGGRGPTSGGQFNSGSLAGVDASDFGGFGTTGSSAFSQEPADVVGDPFFDPMFGSQIAGQQGQTGQPGVTPYVGQQGQQTTAQTPQATQDQQTDAAPVRRNQPMQELSSGLGRIAKLLGGTQQQQGAGWIQPQRQQQPQTPQQAAGVAQAQGQDPQAPQTPETPMAGPVPLPRRRPDEAPQAGPAIPAAGPAGGGGPAPADPVAAAPIAAQAANPQAALNAMAGAAPVTGAGSFPAPSVALMQWLTRLLGGPQAAPQQPQPSQPSVVPQATAAAPVPGAAPGAAQPQPPARAAPDQTAALTGFDQDRALRDVLAGRLPQAPAARPQDDRYNTKLSPEEEARFQQWKAQNMPNDSGADYDQRGAFKAGATADKNGHWPDTFKKPNHPTFSNQSQYATGADRARAGHWEGDRFVSPGQPLSLDPQDYVRSVFAIESGGNPNERTGSNRGLAQFGPAEERMYGINASNRRDPRAQAAALQREYQHHRPILQRALGREPEPWESYFMHQQGIAGGPALLTANPNAPAHEVLRRFYRRPATAVRAIRGNIPRDNPLRRVPPEQVTTGQFREMWRERYNRESNRQRPAPAPQQTGFTTRPGRNALLDWLNQQGAA